MGDSHTRCTCNQPLAGSHFADHEVASENNRIILPRTTAPPSLDHRDRGAPGCTSGLADAGVADVLLQATPDHVGEVFAAVSRCVLGFLVELFGDTE